MFGLVEETGARGGNPRQHRENMQTYTETQTAPLFPLITTVRITVNFYSLSRKLRTLFSLFSYCTAQFM